MPTPLPVSSTPFLHLLGVLSSLGIVLTLVDMETSAKNKQKKGQRPLITYPAEYQIHIQGRLDLGWSDRLAGMSISTRGGKNLTPLTTLQGELIDQSALLGVLNTLHDLGYAVLYLEYLSETHQPGKR